MGFTTKDSGKRVEFASGMKRDVQDGKTLYHLVFDGPMLARWAQLLTRGANKYDAGNWLKAGGQAELDRFRASASRHFFQWMQGDRDEDHAAAVIFNLNGAEYVEGKLHWMEDEAFTGVPADQREHDQEVIAAILAKDQIDRRLPEPDLMGHMMAGTDYFPPVSAAEGIITDPNDSRRGDAGVVLLERQDDGRYARVDIPPDLDETVTFNGVPVEYVPDLARDYETGEPLDLDKCGTLDGVTPLPLMPVATVLAKDHSKEALAQALTDALNTAMHQTTYRTILEAYHERLLAETAEYWEDSLWGYTGDSPNDWTYPKQSRWQRFKAWLCDVFIPPGGGCGHLN